MKPIASMEIAAARKPQEFVCTYYFKGRRYGLNILAESMKDASSHLRAIGTTGSVEGTLAATIPVAPDARFLQCAKLAIAILVGGKTA
ncbi:hypothetical protein LH464_17305 [Neorhizobium sp. T786]|uniref:hypothetical protein n=1 Tax=Pseudorhizobium xiangyangii TaxID=2883104 RepID=UPI001CFF7123|nr:hypothetical protein [Neorhizobium xiangyangii]MCB5204226.1 hypothetical protein [Neorhizobium xiangyangii]